MAIVLASQSPRRQELLARIGVEDFKTLSLDIDESYPEGLSPEDTVRYIAKKKCDAAAALCAPDDLIITADTMVFLGNDRLGKPHDETDAFHAARAFRPRSHGLHGRERSPRRAGRALRRVHARLFPPDDG